MIWMFENRIGSQVMLVALSLAVLSMSSVAPVQAKKARGHQPGNYLVPPPPAYMPSILPELRYGGTSGTPSPSNPYKKYVYSANGYEDPTPVKTHKTVTYWQPENSPIKTP